MAQELGFLGAANVIMLSAYAALEGFPQIEIIKQVIPHSLKRKHRVETNMKMVEAAVAYVAEHPLRAAVGQPARP
jgi:Pyruvate/2-oxoacid:ferredoxin oxidoreductase gamma subunit